MLCALLLYTPVQAAPITLTYGPFSAALATVKLPPGTALADVRLAVEDWCMSADSLLASTEMDPSITCQMEEEPGAWTVLRFTSGPINLATLRVDTVSGEMRLPGEDTLQALADRDFLRAVLGLGNYGIRVDPTWYGQRVTPALVVDWLATDLLFPDEFEDPLWFASALSRKELVDYLLRWATFTEREQNRRGGEPAILREAMDALQLAADLAGFSFDASDGWPDAFGGMDQLPLPRVLYARGAVALLEPLIEASAPGALRDIWLPMLDDTRNQEARMACGLGLMDYVLLEPDGFACFDPDRVMSLDAVREHARRFAEIALDYLNDEPEPVTMGEAASMLHRLLRAFDGRPTYTGPVQVVDNGADAPWYLSQENTGIYSDTNCMPAAAAMALRWFDPNSTETPESLRALFPLDGAPWYPEQVMEVFAEHSVPYSLQEVELDSLVASLDAGHILLVLLNEGGAGHCVIIKGYIREGPGLWFILYDPANPYTDASGEPVGRNRRTEATELLFAIECHWWLYFEIAREGEAGD